MQGQLLYVCADRVRRRDKIFYVVCVLQQVVKYFCLHHVSVGGIMVSIAAFQAVDPGSIPGRRMFWLAEY